MRFALLLPLLFSATSSIASDNLIAGDDYEKLMREAGVLPPRDTEQAKPKTKKKAQRIIVISEDGKRTEYDLSKYKVVEKTETDKDPLAFMMPPMAQCEIPQPQPIAEVQTIEKIIEKEKIVRVEKRVFARHNITGYVGRGYDGLDVTYDGKGNVEIRSKKETVMGASYTYRWNYEWNVSASAISNSSFLVGAGYSF